MLGNAQLAEHLAVELARLARVPVEVNVIRTAGRRFVCARRSGPSDARISEIRKLHASNGKAGVIQVAYILPETRLSYHLINKQNFK